MAPVQLHAASNEPADSMGRSLGLLQLAVAKEANDSHDNNWSGLQGWLAHSKRRCTLAMSVSNMTTARKAVMRIR